MKDKKVQLFTYRDDSKCDGCRIMKGRLIMFNIPYESVFVDDNGPGAKLAASLNIKSVPTLKIGGFSYPGVRRIKDLMMLHPSLMKKEEK